MPVKHIKKFVSSFRRQPQAGRRNLEGRKFNKSEYSSFDSFLRSDKLETELNTIWFGKVALDLLFQFNGKSKPLIVFFHGAVDQSNTVVPHFVGMSYARGLDANLLHIADPSLLYDPSIRSAWYLGCKEIQLQKVLVDVVTHLAKKIGTERIIFFGSSGGGYPSLYLSQHVPNSLAIVNSPATSISKHPKRKTMVSDYLKAAYSTSNQQEEDQVLDNVLQADLRKDFDPEKNAVLYLLNVNDRGNIKIHAKPFFEQFSKSFDFESTKLARIGKLRLLTANWGEGHRYPPARFMKKLLTLAVNIDIDPSSEEFDRQMSS